MFVTLAYYLKVEMKRGLVLSQNETVFGVESHSLHVM